MPDKDWHSPKAAMASAYEKETGMQLDKAGLNAAYASIVDSFHGEIEEFVRKYCPKRLVELDALMDQVFWQYH